jgi:sugar lactone lactonase YvrE
LPYTQEDLQVFASGFELANGLGLGPDGAVYATDAGASILYRITEQGGELEPVIEGLVFPRDIRFDEDGRLIASVIREGRVVAIGEDGKVTTLLDGLEGASGLVIADDGTLYASGLLDGRILRLEPNGQPEVFASGLAGPSGLALDPDGNLYVGLFNAGEEQPCVLRYSPDGGEPEVIAAGFTKTLGVVWGPDDMLYVAHVLDGRAVIVRFPSEGASELFLDSELPGPLLGPLFGPDGFAYIMSVDGKTNAVHRFDVRDHVPIR